MAILVATMLVGKFEPRPKQIQIGEQDAAPQDRPLSLLTY